MTKERILEAINANDPDERGLERVLTALKKTNNYQYDPEGLFKLSSKKCLLARAWDAFVSRRSFFRTSIWSDETDHNYHDVTSWFDKEDRTQELMEMFKEELSDEVQA